MSDIVLSGGIAIVPDDPGRVAARRCDVLLRDQWIVAVGGEGQVPVDFDPEVRDVSGCFVMPGLVNAHGHAAMSLLRGYADDLPLMEWLEERIWPIEEEMTEADIAAGTALAVAEMLLGGTTCFADMYFAMERVADVCRDLGIRAVLSRGLIGFGEGAQRGLEESRRLVKRWHKAEGGRITVSLGPHAPYTCPPDYLETVVEMARKLRVGIHTHLAETEGEVREIMDRYGKGPVDYYDEVGLLGASPVTLAHGVHLDEADMRKLAARGAGVVPCPRSNLRLASGIAQIEEMLDVGLTVGLGTDGAASAGTLDMWEEMRFASYLQKGSRLDARAMPASRALYLATRGGASALGLEDVGELSPGFRADIIVVRSDSSHMTPLHDPLSSLLNAAGPGDVDSVMVDGADIVADSHLVSNELERILQESRSSARAMVERVERK
ncbi:MAG: amidohydrolase [Clostridia bacterium]